ncbi:hypothetical protein HY386_02095 [Candidatus Daviesbacteria bacterium]|nr:hypothetical protein [Candidatus Daviesbacteria bacterium]
MVKEISSSAVAVRRVEMTVVTGIPQSSIPSSNYQVSKQAAELVAGTSIPQTAVAKALHEGHGYPLAKISTNQPFKVREDSPVSAVGVHQGTGAVVLYEVQRAEAPLLSTPQEELALVQRPQTLVAKGGEGEEKMVSLVVVMPDQPEKLAAANEVSAVTEEADRDRERSAWAEAILRKY